MSYDTGNPLGSTDPRDLYDNSENLDYLVNGEQPSYDDRLGNARKSWAGIEADFQEFLSSSGYVGTGTGGAIQDYAAGIEVTAYNQIIRDGGEFWRAAAGTELPYTTTGAGMPEGGAFVSVGDAVLRQDLADQSGAGFGTDIVGHDGGTARDAINQRTIYVGSVAESLSGSDGIDGQVYQAQGWHEGSTEGGSVLVYDASADKSDHGKLGWSPTVPAVSEQAGATLSDRTDNYLSGTGETDPGGTGLYLIQRAWSPLNFGAVYGDDTFDNSVPGAAYLSNKAENRGLSLVGKNLSDGVLLTVGAGGDFSSINEAVSSLMSDRFSVSYNRTPVEIRLLSGFVMSEQLIIFNTNLGFVKITSEDAEVTIDRSALTSEVLSYLFQSNYPAFGIMENSVGPVIDVLFDMDSSGSGTNRTGILCNTDSFIFVLPGAGVKNAGHRGLHISHSRAIANSTIWDGAGDLGVRAGNVSEVWAEGVSCDNCGSGGVAFSTSRGSVKGGHANNTGGYGLSMNRGSIVQIDEFTANGNTLGGISGDTCQIFADNSEFQNNGGYGVDLQNCFGSIRFLLVTGNTDRNVNTRGGDLDMSNSTIGGGASEPAINLLSVFTKLNLSSSDIANASSVNLQLSNKTDCNARNATVTGAGGSNDIIMSDGSSLSIHGGTYGSANIAALTLTSSGIIFE